MAFSPPAYSPSSRWVMARRHPSLQGRECAGWHNPAFVITRIFATPSLRGFAAETVPATSPGQTRKGVSPMRSIRVAPSCVPGLRPSAPGGASQMNCRRGSAPRPTIPRGAPTSVVTPRASLPRPKFGSHYSASKGLLGRCSLCLKFIFSEVIHIIVVIEFSHLLVIQSRTGLMGAVRPQTPHRSPRQAFGGNLIKALRARKNIVKRALFLSSGHVGLIWSSQEPCAS